MLEINKNRGRPSLFWLIIISLVLGISPSAGTLTAADVSVTVDHGKTYQLMHGFGTCTVQWNAQVEALYGMESFIDTYVHDLGSTLNRFEIYPVLTEPVENWEDISYEMFDLDNSGRRIRPSLQFAAAVYKEIPDQMKLIPAVWSPPAWMKENKSRNRIDHEGNENPDTNRLLPEYYPHFAKYLAEWIRMMDEVYGVPLYAVSLQNELHFSQPYNSCVYTDEEYRDLLKVVGPIWDGLGIETKIYGPEDMTDQTSRILSYIRTPMRDPEAALHLDIIASHGYADGIASSNSLEGAQRLYELTKMYGKEIWMTETSGEGPLWEDDAYVGRSGDPLPGAFNGLAGKIHNALVYGHVSGWSYWQITDVEEAAEFALMNLDQKTKKYYATKHYSKAIRPGACRVDASPTGGASKVDVSAFKHDGNQTLSIIILNRNEDAREIEINLSHATGISAMSAWRTSASEDFLDLGAIPVADNKLTLRLPGMSMVTLHASGADLSYSGWYEHDVIGRLYHYPESEARYSEWLGTLYVDNLNWFYTETLGWVYAFLDRRQGIWMWTQVLGWFWSDQDIFPWAYMLDSEEWRWL